MESLSCPRDAMDALRSGFVRIYLLFCSGFGRIYLHFYRVSGRINLHFYIGFHVGITRYSCQPEVQGTWKMLIFILESEDCVAVLGT